MNKERRKRLDEVMALVSEARGQLEEIAGEEREAVDNLPDGLRESERGERMEEIADSLEEDVSSWKSSKALCEIINP
ncbi:MAG: hypothetical protein ACLU98_06755 [Desulfovibrio fairfieldensis]